MNAIAIAPRRPTRHGDLPDHPQYMRALERANQVRLARAELKRKVAAAEIDVTDVILDCPWEASSMAIGDLLMSQRRWGQMRCRKFLIQVPITEMKTIGSMTERQRLKLAQLLRAATGAGDGGESELATTRVDARSYAFAG
jgi:hypothetical protein